MRGSCALPARRRGTSPCRARPCGRGRTIRPAAARRTRRRSAPRVLPARRSQIVGRLVCKIARTIRPARDDDGALGFRLNRVVSADEDKVVNPVLPPLGLPEAPGRTRPGSARRRPREPAPPPTAAGVVQHPRDRPADRLHEPGDPAGRGPDGVGVDLLAEAADGDALAPASAGRWRSTAWPAWPRSRPRRGATGRACEITRRLGSVANRERNNLGLDGKGVGARYRNLHRTGRC